MSSAGSYGAGGGGGGVGNVKFLTGNSGGPVGPDLVGNINVVGTGDISVAGNAGTNTLTISLSGAIADVYDTDSGSATPSGGVLNINGLAGLTTSGSGNTIDISTDGTIAINYVTDSGTAMPSADSINIVGGTGIATSGAGSTITITSTATGVTSIQGDTGGPISGALTITGGGTGLLFDTSGSPDILLEANFLSLPDTNNILTTGYIAIGGTPVLAMCGGVANSNVCVGPVSGTAGMTGINNVSVGAGSLSHGSNSVSNTVSIGTNSCQNLATGAQNISIGTDALNSATSSTGNVAIGYGAATALLTGTDNIIIGLSAGGNYTGAESSNILIGSNGTTGESNALHIGSAVTTASIGGIYGVSVGGTNAPVFIDNTGKLGTGAGTGLVTSITGDAGGALSGAITVTGGSSGAFYTGTGGNTLTTTFTKLALPDTSGSNGIITINGVSYLAAYGGTSTLNFFAGNAGNSSITGIHNTAVGSTALVSLTSGGSNSAYGAAAADHITTGSQNVAIGNSALFTATTDGTNVAVGNGSLMLLNGSAGGNTGIGYQALNQVATGTQNTALGYNAGQAYTSSESSNITIGNIGTVADSHQIRIGTQGSGTGQQNLCNIAGIYGSTVGGTNAAVFIDNAGNLGTVGGSGGGGVTSITGDTGTSQTGALNITGGTSGALFNTSGSNITESFHFLAMSDTTSTTGYIKIGADIVLNCYGGVASNNIFVGQLAGHATVSGTDNAALGDQALNSVTTGNFNVAIGSSALQVLTTSSENVAIGLNALSALTTGGGGNTVVGFAAGGSFNTGANNLILGSTAGGGYTGAESNNIVIGAQGVAAETHAIHIGDDTTYGAFTKCFIGGIAGVTVTSTAAVLVNTSTNQLGTVISSRRFKENIEDMGTASRDIYKLRPVKFNFKGDFNQSYGLIAEDVEEAMPYLVSYDKEGLPVTVKYHELPALLLNEIQRLKLKIDELEGKFNARLR